MHIYRPLPDVSHEEFAAHVTRWPVDDLAALDEILAASEGALRGTDEWYQWLRIKAYVEYRREQ